MERGSTTQAIQAQGLTLDHTQFTIPSLDPVELIDHSTPGIEDILNQIRERVSVAEDQVVAMGGSVGSKGGGYSIGGLPSLGINPLQDIIDTIMTLGDVGGLIFLGNLIIKLYITLSKFNPGNPGVGYLKPHLNKHEVA